MPLFQFKFKFPKRFADFYEKVHDLLLDYTVHEAYKHSEFYHNLYPGLAEHDFIDKEKLKDFPVIFRRQVEEAGRTICSKAVDYGFSSYTGGTTTNNPLIIDRSQHEQQFLHNFFLNIHKDSKNEVKLVLSLAIPYHGNVLQIPVRNVLTFPVAVTDESQLNHAVKLLNRTFKIKGEEKVISYISGSVGVIAKFTAYIRHTGAKNIEKNIKEVHAGACYLTKYTSEWIRDFWKCEIMNTFSFTELFFKANKCRECGLYHFEPFGIAEVLDIHSNRRIDSGRGRLFVTGLYPFTQMTPLIRYFTGDLVEIRKINCPYGEYGFLFLGRQKNSLIFQKGNSDCTFLSSGEVYEVLDGLPDVNIHKMKGFSPCCDSIGVKPIFWFENDPQNTIHIELRYSPVFYPDRLKELANIIKTNLISKCSGLERIFEKQLISLKFHPPNSASQEIENAYRP